MIASACAASATRTGQAGTSASHSISVGDSTVQSDGVRIELPDDVLDRTVVRVDEKRTSFVVGPPRVAGEVDFLDLAQRKGVDIGDRVPLLIGRGDTDVVDV